MRQLIIICHGFQASADHPALVTIADGLMRAGFDTFRITFSKGRSAVDMERQVLDIIEATKQHDDYDGFILIGHSLAALSVAIAANKLPKVQGIITINGYFGMWHLGPKLRNSYVMFRIAALVVPTQKSIFQYFKQGLQPAEITVPMLVIHSKVDRSVYYKQSKRLYVRLAEPKQFVELETASHNLHGQQDRELVINEIIQWLTANFSN